MISLESRTVVLLCIVILSIGLLGCGRDGQNVQRAYGQDQYLSREGQIDGTRFRYRVYLPPNRKADGNLPIMLYLHGAGNRGSDNELQLNGLAEQIEANRLRIDFIIVIPQCPPDRFWDEKLLIEAKQALDDTVSEFKADKDRLYLMGFSLGGYGVWTMAAMYPGKFAAIVPMSGRVLPRSSEMKSISSEIAALTKAEEPYSAFAARLGNTPTWIFHGAEDGVVPIEGSRKIFAAMKGSGNQYVKYDEVAGAGHEPMAFRTDGFFEWLNQQHLY
ncbi:MAG: prolyl oligopeptidase family serine peptidase [Acidobacteria bacterium]|nr:prolyl oligopeptidase family serine peptidase [Acidobacteriota bacterium]